MKHEKLFLAMAVTIFAGCASTSKSKTEVVPVTPPKTSAAAVQPAATPAPATTAPVAKPTAIDVFVCTRDSDVRELYIEPVTPLGCKLWYSNLKGQPVASSVKGLTHCESVNQKIRGNLETAGFKCAASATQTAAQK